MNSLVFDEDGPRNQEKVNQLMKTCSSVLFYDHVSGKAKLDPACEEDSPAKVEKISKYSTQSKSKEAGYPRFISSNNLA